MQPFTRPVIHHIWETRTLNLYVPLIFQLKMKPTGKYIISNTAVVMATSILFSSTSMFIKHWTVATTTNALEPPLPGKSTVSGARISTNSTRKPKAVAQENAQDLLLLIMNPS